MSSFTLTDHQKAFFETFGYLVFPGLMSDCIDEITRAFLEVFERRGLTHGGQERTSMIPFIDDHERLCTLLDDSRIDGITKCLLGDDYNYVSSDGNFYVGDTHWHCDSMHEHYDFIKISLYLDPVGRDTGALRVIPGSHIVNKAREDLGFAVRDCTNALGVHGRDVPCVALDSNPGDLVVFHHTTLHASYGGSESRRMFTYNMSQHYADEHLDDLHKYLGVVDGVAKSCYGPTLVDTAGPERRRHLQQVLDSTSAAKPQER
jgi:hypothetical protein